MAISTELRQLVEDLALRAVVAEGPCASEEQLAEWVAALNRLQETASRTNASEVAASAAQVVQAVRTSPMDRVLSELQSGISRVQDALDGADQIRLNDRPPAQDPELLGDFVMESQ